MSHMNLVNGVARHEFPKSSVVTNRCAEGHVKARDMLYITCYYYCYFFFLSLSVG